MTSIVNITKIILNYFNANKYINQELEPCVKILPIVHIIARLFLWAIQIYLE